MIDIDTRFAFVGLLSSFVGIVIYATILYLKWKTPAPKTHKRINYND